MINAPNFPNLPVARLVSAENNSPEIETLNPVNINRPVLATIATKEDVDTSPDPEMAIIDTPYENHVNTQHIVEINDNIFPSNHRNITKFMSLRKRGLICYSFIFMAHLLYIFVNPIGIIFLLNIFYNLFTLISGNINLIKTNIIANITSILFIILADILFTFNIDTLTLYILKNNTDVVKIELYYLITIYVTSIIVIITYLYLTLILNKMRLVYNTLSQHQINILSIRLNK